MIDLKSRLFSGFYQLMWCPCVHKLTGFSYKPDHYSDQCDINRLQVETHHEKRSFYWDLEFQEKVKTAFN